MHIQQDFIVEFIVVNGFCDQCHKEEAKNTWTSVVQVRQRVEHKRTIFRLEQEILTANAQQNATDIQAMPDGMDVFFVSVDHAKKFVDFLHSLVPLQVKQSKKLVSQDDHKNTYDFKVTFAVEVVPICRQDLCFLAKGKGYASGVGPIVFCTGIAGTIHLVDILKGTELEVNAQQFFAHPFRTMMNSRQLTEYYVVDVIPLGKPVGKFQLADVQIIKADEFGVTEDYFFVKSFLGNKLAPGDYAIGYDLKNMNINDEEIERYLERGFENETLPDVVLVAKGHL